MMPAEEVRNLVAELGDAIHKVLTRIPGAAPSLEGQSVAVIEERLKEEVDQALRRLHLLNQRLDAWQQAK